MVAVTFHLVAQTRIAPTKYRPLCDLQKMQQSKQTTRFRPLCCLKSFKFCHRAVEDPRGEVGGLSSEMRVRVIAQKKATAESTMGFLCMSPNGPLYGQNVWAMRIYASSSYLAPRCFTPTNSPTAFILPSALKKTFGWVNSFLSVFCIHSQPGWDGRAEA